VAAVTLNWSGGDKFARILSDAASNLANAKQVSVGFLEGSYPDGEGIAQVAFWNEFGTVNQVPRPFFRRMIAKESRHWGADLAASLKKDYDAKKALGLMGEQIKGELVQSINDFTDPPLKPSTIKRKGFAKPLIDTALMVRSVDSEVK
jgi:hypothetical protein